MIGIRSSSYRVPRFGLPGTTGNYLSTPSAAANQIVGDFCIVTKCSVADWSPTVRRSLVSKYVSTGNQRAYRLALNTAGALELSWSTDGTAVGSLTSSSNLSAVANNQVKWVAACLRVNNAGQKTANFWHSDDIQFPTPTGVTWTALGTGQNNAGVAVVFGSSAILEVGSFLTGTSELAPAGTTYYADVRNGVGTSGAVGGMIVAVCDSRVARATPGTTWVASTGETWTRNGTVTVAA